MIFATPWALLGLGLASIPILLHLLARREPPTVVFPATRYLAQTAKLHQRRLQLQHLLLLLRQIALCLFLQHANNVDPMFTQFQIDIALVRYRMLHHSQRGGSVLRDRHEEIDETCGIVSAFDLFAVKLFFRFFF